MMNIPQLLPLLPRYYATHTLTHIHTHTDVHSSKQGDRERKRGGGGGSAGYSKMGTSGKKGKIFQQIKSKGTGKDKRQFSK